MPSHPLKPSKQPKEEKSALRKKEISKNSLSVPGGKTGGTAPAPGKGSHEQAVPEGSEGLSVPPPAQLPDGSDTWHGLVLDKLAKEQKNRTQKRETRSCRNVQDGKLG